MDMVRAIALGADGTNAARSMMLALGCIQSRRCHDNTCPVGVATQDPGRAAGLVVSDKAARVAAFHQETVEAFLELVASMGCEDPGDLDPHYVTRRIDERTVATYDQLYPVLPTGSLLEPGDAAPPEWRDAWAAVARRLLRVTSTAGPDPDVLVRGGVAEKLPGSRASSPRPPNPPMSP